MAVLTVYGASDDLVELEGIEGADEFYADSNSKWTGMLTAPDGTTAILYVDYRGNACWTAALGCWEGDYVLPDWEVKTSIDDSLCSYSTITHITVPDGTVVTEIKD